MQDIIPRDVPVGEAMALLAGLLVKCIDEGDLRTAQELMKHELFNSRTLEGVVLYARRETESALPRSDGYPYRQEYIPGHGKFMVYRVLPSIFTLEL